MVSSTKSLLFYFRMTSFSRMIFNFFFPFSMFQGVMELCTKGLGSSVNLLKQRNVNLSCVRTCVVVAEERPRISLTSSFSKLFSALGLSPRAVSTSFGCRVNVAICLQVPTEMIFLPSICLSLFPRISNLNFF